ncbi:MAG: GlsB/YeaQ/YmgE family stress response membrane protein [Candidatus Humimicrobiia bacterium]
MDLTSLIIFILVGLIAGWLAGMIMKGKGFGLISNIIIGLIGGLLGGWIFKSLNWSIGTGVVSSIITSLIGAIILLVILSFFKKKS